MKGLGRSVIDVSCFGSIQMLSEFNEKTCDRLGSL